MNVGKTIFAQTMDFVPWTSFGRIVERYSGNAGVRRMSCAEQFRVMAFAQLTWRESLRDMPGDNYPDRSASTIVAAWEEAAVYGPGFRVRAGYPPARPLSFLKSS